MQWDHISGCRPAGRTYRHLQVPVLYPFGYGLSYTAFEYSNLRSMSSASVDGAFQHTVSVCVRNTGKSRSVVRVTGPPMKALQYQLLPVYPAVHWGCMHRRHPWR
jgi:hypothetical protein